jgi:hypothetical protein
VQPLAAALVSRGLQFHALCRARPRRPEPPRANTQRVQQSLKVCAFVHRNSFDPKGTILLSGFSPAYGLLISSGNFAMFAAIRRASSR